ncbi:N-acetyltransferase 9 [Amniculicola lignicola CBS 123094]|uniref:N-acetyltransferase 9 n=1 Tax=Amniculicola lignicola CBS 123094 TaxID=1392246 RepID=A0A6A5WD81_9PLEO|nr:N-acetyltransferase 9 [Amniculicola lignicola CBS 123094]
MKLNEHQAILTPKILLVPYSEHHVPTYHEWMKDEDLQKATASNPLTLPEEYAMQQSWRTDTDKLTFIICHAPTPGVTNVNFASETVLKKKGFKLTPGKEDSPEKMLGDVNLFLYADEGKEADIDWRSTDERVKGIVLEKGLMGVIGEVEIMIARKEAQGVGLGKETLLAFLWYIISSFSTINSEFHSTNGNGKPGSYLKYLRVKIGEGNAGSLRLFESVGFKKVEEKPNYFGEMELRWGISVNSMSDIELKMDDVPLITQY